jgi:hypothetical protein
LGAAAGARRQNSTFPLFRKAQNTAQLGIANSGQVFGFANVNFEYARRLPQVVDAASFHAFLAFIKTSRGVSLTPIGDQNPVVNFASPDGRFDTVLNRMLIIEGGYADPGAVDEAVVSYLAARSYNIHVGDYLDYALPSFKDFANGPSTTRLTGPHPRVRVVGIEAQSYELPPGLGYPPIHLTPAFYRAFISKTPTFTALLLKLRHENDVPAVLDAIQKHGLLGGASASTRVQAFNEPQNAAAVTRTVHIQAIALWLLALLAGITSLLVVGQAIIRQSFIESDENPALRALGMTSGQVLTTALVRLLIVSAVGAVIAVAVAVAVSPLTPIGLSGHPSS